MRLKWTEDRGGCKGSVRDGDRSLADGGKADGVLCST